MPSCFLPDSTWWIIPPTAGALLGALLASIIGHAVIKAMMETRGVAPWGKRDSLGAMPLVLMGAMLLGAGAALATVTLLAHCAPTVAIMLLLPVALGFALVRSGTLALRRLV